MSTGANAAIALRCDDVSGREVASAPLLPSLNLGVLCTRVHSSHKNFIWLLCNQCGPGKGGRWQAVIALSEMRRAESHRKATLTPGPSCPSPPEF